MTKAQKAVFKKIDGEVDEMRTKREASEAELKSAEADLHYWRIRELQAIAALSALIEYVNCNADAEKVHEAQCMPICARVKFFEAEKKK